MKNRQTAGFLALFGGFIGLHRFYLRQPGLGILYIILLTVFGISFLLGLIDALAFFLMSDEYFDEKYNGPYITELPGVRIRERHKLRERQGASNYRKQSRKVSSRSMSSSHPILRKNPYKKSGIEKYRDYDLVGAIEDFKKGLEVSPKDASLHFNIACAYSLTEQKIDAFKHLSEAVELGFRDFDKIDQHDALAYLRVQEEWENFKKNGYKWTETPKLEEPKEDLLQDDLLLSQLKKLSDLKEKGLITELEFEQEKEKLLK